jgi:hypothetical protein
MFAVPESSKSRDFGLWSDLLTGKAGFKLYCRAACRFFSVRAAPGILRCHW